MRDRFLTPDRVHRKGRAMKALRNLLAAISVSSLICAGIAASSGAGADEWEENIASVDSEGEENIASVDSEGEENVGSVDTEGEENIASVGTEGEGNIASVGVEG